MKMQVSDKAKTQDLVRRMFWLAWRACGGTFGSGFMQDNPAATEGDVWFNIFGRGDYPGGPRVPGLGIGVKSDRADADYVFGRMMKMRVEFNAAEGVIDLGSRELRLDYQAWCGTYPSYEALAQKAAAELGLTLTVLENATT